MMMMGVVYVSVVE